jgi:hypothetical protein
MLVARHFVTSQGSDSGNQFDWPSSRTGTEKGIGYFVWSELESASIFKAWMNWKNGSTTFADPLVPFSLPGVG